MFVCLDELVFPALFEQITGTENLNKHSHDMLKLLWMSFIDFIFLTIKAADMVLLPLLLKKS